MSIFRRKIGENNYAGWSSVEDKELKEITEQLESITNQVKSLEQGINEFVVALRTQGKGREKVFATLPLRAEKLDALAGHVKVLLDLVREETDHAVRTEKLSRLQKAYTQMQRPQPGKRLNIKV